MTDPQKGTAADGPDWRETRFSAVERERDALQARNKMLEQFLEDTCTDMECLPACDTYGHEPDCPLTNPMAGFRTLQARCAAQDKGIKWMDAHLARYGYDKDTAKACAMEIGRIRAALAKGKDDG